MAGVYYSSGYRGVKGTGLLEDGCSNSSVLPWVGSCGSRQAAHCRACKPSVGQILSGPLKVACLARIKRPLLFNFLP
jgi:hypothetical protein